MKLVTLRAGAAEAALAPEIGGSIASFAVDGVAVLRPIAPEVLAAPHPRGLGSYPLIPFSNRVAYRRFAWAGVTHRLPALLGGHAIHGAAWQAPWQVAEAGPDHARLVQDHAAGPSWPFAYRAEQAFKLTPDRLTVTISLTSRHHAPAPGGFGLHPFFPRTPGMRLHFAAGHVWHNEEPEKIPVFRSAVPPAWDHRDGLPVGQVLNQCYAGWDGVARLAYPEHGRVVRIDADPVFRHLVVFVPADLDFLAVEPVTNMNDGLNRMAGGLDHGVFVLAPGETRSGQVAFSVAPG